MVAGCSPADDKPLPSGFVTGTSIHTINVGGRDRSYRLYQPAGLPASAPLVVMLHGVTGSAEQAERSYGWDELADSQKFVVAYPDGVSRAWNVNGGGCCGRPREKASTTSPSSARPSLTSCATSASTPAQIYATGMSNGGIMSYTLACDTGVFAAIGAVAGTQLDSCRAPHPTSVMEIHGTSDGSFPIRVGRARASSTGPRLRT